MSSEVRAPGRLVVMAPNWLGDAIMALPLLSDLNRAWPATHITVAARRSVAPLFTMVPAVGDVLTLGSRSGRDTLRTWRSDTQQLEKGKFGAALLLPNSFWSAWLTSRARIPERWGFARDLRGRLLTRAIKRPTTAVHQAEYYQALAEAFFPGRKADKMAQSEQFFLNASRDIFARMLEFEPSPTQLVAWLADEEEIDRMCEGTELANYIRSDAAPQRAGVLGSLARVGKTLRILPLREECDFDFSLTDWAKERQGWIFLTSTKEAEERLRPLYTSYLDLLMRRLMSVDDSWGRTQPVKLIVDEVHTLETQVANN